jgi:hypothetical protein
LTAALRVAFFATTLRAEVLVAGFFAAFAAEGFFVTTLFAVFFAAAFAIMIGPSRLIPSRENSSVRRRCNADVNFAFFLRASERAAEQGVPSGGLSNKHAHVAINSLCVMARRVPAQGAESDLNEARAMASAASIQRTCVSATTMFSGELRDSGDRGLVDRAAIRAPRAVGSYAGKSVHGRCDGVAPRRLNRACHDRIFLGDERHIFVARANFDRSARPESKRIR